MILDDAAYEVSHALRLAHADGQLEMCQLMIAITQRMLVERNLTMSKNKTDFEKGQINAYESILNGCNGFLKHNKVEKPVDTKYDC